MSEPPASETPEGQGRELSLHIRTWISGIISVDVLVAVGVAVGHGAGATAPTSPTAPTAAGAARQQQQL